MVANRIVSLPGEGHIYNTKVSYRIIWPSLALHRLMHLITGVNTGKSMHVLITPCVYNALKMSCMWTACTKLHVQGGPKNLEPLFSVRLNFPKY